MKKNQSLKVVIDDYIPMLEEDDITELVNFVVELFCAGNANEVLDD